MRTLFLIALVIASLTLKAETFTIEGLTYTTTTGYECKVSGYTDALPESVIIPATVANNDIEYTVTAIGNDAFSRNKSIQAITLPDGISAIERGSFNECTSLTKINIPEGVTSLASYTFCNCTSLTAIELPSNLTYIGEFCFSNCSGLISVKMPPAIRSIGMYCFSRCSALKDIIIPEGIATLYEYTFYSCASLESIVLPSTLTSIGSQCFRYCSSLSTVEFPESLKEIDTYAFAGCSSLVSINIPQNVNRIGSYCLWGCTNLESVKLNEGLKSLNPHLFRDCKSLKHIEVPNSINTIDEYCFWGCTSLDDISLPTSLIRIEKYCFLNCASLTHIEIPEGTTKLDFGAFESCSTLERISLPSSLKTIGGLCFKDCISLNNIEIPDGPTEIGGSTFQNCSMLKTISLPSSLKTIGSNCFNNCSSLARIDIPDGVTDIDIYTFKNCTSLEDISLPSSLNSVTIECFNNCSKLSQIIIPDAVTRVGSNAFNNCYSLESVTIGRNVNTIETRAFNGCTNLRSVTCRNLLPPTSGAFDDLTYTTAALHVDNSCEHLYKEHEIWSKFAKVEPVDFGYTTTFDLNDWETIKQLYTQLQDAGWKGKWHVEIGPNIAPQLSNLVIENDHVVEISLPNSCVSTQAFTSILQFTKARAINVSGNTISGDISALIEENATNTNLTYLDISSNNFSGNLALANDRFPSLNTLYANNNRFSEIDPYINAQTLRCNAQTIPDTIRWTLGPIDKQTALDDIPSIMKYVHYNKSFEAPDLIINSYADRIDIRARASGANYIFSPYSTGSSYKFVFTIDGKYDLYIKTADDRRAPLLLDFIEGDCNCDAICDITDVQSLVNYALGYGPGGKIFNEKVVNFDGNETLNVIDIIGLVNYLLDQDTPQTRTMAASIIAIDKSDAEVLMDGDKLMLNTSRSISAIDFTLRDTNGFTMSPALQKAGFICSARRQGKAERVIIYSINGAEMPEGITELGTSIATIGTCQASSPDGERVQVSVGVSTSSSVNVETDLSLTIGSRLIGVPSRYANGQWTLYDTAGRRLASGIILTSGNIHHAADSNCILVITAEGEEPHAIKINL